MSMLPWKFPLPPRLWRRSPEAIRAVRLKAGDVVVLKSDKELSGAVIAALVSRVRTVMPDGVRILMLPPHLHLDVIEAGDADDHGG